MGALQHEESFVESSERKSTDTRDYMNAAERIALDYDSASLASDEAELLRGCLYALVAIARIQYGGTPD